MMAGVNLLPWREWQRERSVRRLQLALLAAVVSGAMLALATAILLERQLGDYLREGAATSERITGLETVLADVAALKARRDGLLEQRAGLLELQRQPGIDLLTRLMHLVPEQARLDELHLTREELRLSGFARSGGDVAQLLRNLAQAPGVQTPELQEVTSTRGGERFQVLLGLREPS